MRRKGPGFGEWAVIGDRQKSEYAKLFPGLSTGFALRIAVSGKTLGGCGRSSPARPRLSTGLPGIPGVQNFLNFTEKAAIGRLRVLYW